MGRRKDPKYLDRDRVDMEYWQRRADARRFWVARVRKAAKDNPDLSWDLLAERFGVETYRVRGVCTDIHREPDLFSLGRDRWHRKHG